MKTKITEYMTGKEKVTLKDIYGLFPEKKDYIVRTIINQMAKKGTIIRLSRGEYKLA